MKTCISTNKYHIVEVYKAVDGFSKYEVSNYGNVRYSFNGKIFKQHSNSYGYKQVCLRGCDGVVKHLRVHRLVAKAFIPNPNNLPLVDHIDNDRGYNKITNLRWCTPHQNNCNQMISIKNTTGVKGITFDKRSGKWRTTIGYKGERILIGYFFNFEDAVTRRKAKAKELYGEFVNSCEL